MEKLIWDLVEGPDRYGRGSRWTAESIGRRYQISQLGLDDCPFIVTMKDKTWPRNKGPDTYRASDLADAKAVAQALEDLFLHR